MYCPPLIFVDTLMEEELVVGDPVWHEVQSDSPGAPVTPVTGPEAEE